jgi:hypothetical protein
MKKKVFIISGIAIVALVFLFFWLKNYTKSHSPVATSSYTSNGANIEIVYCKPQKKGRIIFGDETSGAIQPYGRYWRLGANEATTFSTDKDLEIGSGTLKAGKYQLYAIPGKSTWQIVFNSEWDRWGATEANHSTDVLSISVDAKNDAAEKEILAIQFENDIATASTFLNIHWDKTSVSVPFKIRQN